MRFRAFSFAAATDFGDRGGLVGLAGRPARVCKKMETGESLIRERPVRLPTDPTVVICERPAVVR